MTRPTDAELVTLLGDAGVFAAGHRNDRLAKECRDALNELRAADALASSGAPAPPLADVGPLGMWTCGRCSFSLTTKVINVATGTIGMRDAKREVCPNDGADLRRVSWREYAESQEKGIARLMELLDEKEAAPPRSPAPPSGEAWKTDEKVNEYRKAFFATVAGSPPPHYFAEHGWLPHEAVLDVLDLLCAAVAASVQQGEQPT